MARKFLKIIFSVFILLTVFNFGSFFEKGSNFSIKPSVYAVEETVAEKQTRIQNEIKANNDTIGFLQAKLAAGTMTSAEYDELEWLQDANIALHQELEAMAAADIATTVAEDDGTYGFFKDFGNVSAGIGFLGLNTAIRLIILPFVSGILWLVGNIFDLSLAFTIFSVGSVIDASLIEQVWRVVRDFINVGFIFMLLYIAIKTILGLSSQNNKKILASIILAAIFVNFSLFVTRIIIDTSNIISATIYNKMISEAKETRVKLGASPTESISAGTLIMSGFKLQTFNSTSVSDKPWYKKLGEKIKEGLEMLTFTSFLNGLLNLALVLITIWMFTYATALLVGRLVGIIILMVTSPLAFVGGAIPFLKSQSEEWWKNLINFSLIGPIFMFFLLLIIKFLGARTDLIGALTKTGTSIGIGDSTLTIMGEFLFFFIIVFLMITAVKKTKELSGALGGIIDKITQAIIIAIGMAVTGGASAAMSLGSKAAVSMGSAAARGATSGNKLISGLSRTYTGISNSGIVKATSKTIGFGKGVLDSALTGKKADEGTVSGRIINSLGGAARSRFKSVSGIDMSNIEKEREKWKKDYEKSVASQADKIGPKEDLEKIKTLEAMQRNIETQSESNFRRSPDAEDKKTVTEFDEATKTHEKNTTDKKASDERLKQLALELNNVLLKNPANSTKAGEAQKRFDEEENKNKEINKNFGESKTKLDTADTDFKEKQKKFTTEVEDSMGVSLTKIKEDIKSTSALITKKTLERNEFIAKVEKQGFFTTGTTQADNKKLADKLRSGKGVENEDKKNLEAIKKALKDSGIDLGGETEEKKTKDAAPKKEEPPKPPKP